MASKEEKEKLQQQTNEVVLLNGPRHDKTCRERSSSVVECLTRDREATGSSLTSVTAL